MTPTAAQQWTAYRLECWRSDNNIDQYQPARVEPDYWQEAFESLWALDAKEPVEETEPELIDCPTCDGYGEVERGYGDEAYNDKCPDCDGTGKVEKEEDTKVFYGS